MTRATRSAWTPRSSAMGGYMQCDLRAAFDRLDMEGALALGPADRAAVEAARASSPYADLGTCEHFELQDGLRCLWAGNDPLRHRPLPEQYENAAKLFSGDLSQTMTVIRTVAAYAAKYVPASPDGKPWIAERKFASPWMTGTIDFLAQDASVFGDLKTTSRKPAGGKPKWVHVVQMTAYHLLTGAEQGWILYVDAQRASWALLSWVDFRTEAMQEFAAQVRSYAEHLQSLHFTSVAIPRLGDHCSDNFCPYRGICRDRYQPAAGETHDVQTVMPAPLNPFAAFGKKTS